MPHPLYDGRTYLYTGERYNVKKKTFLLRWSVSWEPSPTLVGHWLMGGRREPIPARLSGGMPIATTQDIHELPAYVLSNLELENAYHGWKAEVVVRVGARYLGGPIGVRRRLPT